MSNITEAICEIAREEAYDIISDYDFDDNICANLRNGEAGDVVADIARDTAEEVVTDNKDDVVDEVITRLLTDKRVIEQLKNLIVEAIVETKGVFSVRD